MRFSVPGMHSIVGKATKLLLTMLVSLLSVAASIAQTLPEGFSRVTVATGLNRPSAMALAPDGRIFYAEQDGNLRVIKNNILLSTPFVSLRVRSAGERGLIGVVLDPNFSSNGYIYLYYTVAEGPARNRISRFTAKGDVALAGSEQVILDLDELSGATNHNGGAMRFGVDGMLYVAIGENANKLAAQDLNTYFGKIIRIKPDGGIPIDNPYKNGTPQRKRVWAYGLRNPFTFDIQPGTGKIFVNDVGWNSWEEINDASKGARNFGWPYSEGATFLWRGPLYSYPHGRGDGKGCGITGGAFFSPTTTSYPEKYKGRYFFIDLCNNWINTLDITSGAVREPFATDIGAQSVSLTLGPDGNLYYLSRVDDYNYNSESSLYKIVYSGTKAPMITANPVGRSVSEGEGVTFNVGASGAELKYQWLKNGTNIAGATGTSYTILKTSVADAGKYSVIISNSLGKAVSREAILTVTSQNNAPTAKILSPTSSFTYRAGETIKITGQGTDPEEGTLPASAFSWTVIFHHDTHTHPGPSVAQGTKETTFVIPNVGEEATNVWYRLVLTVQDSKGKAHSTYVDIRPQLVTLSLATQPAGLGVQFSTNSSPTPFAQQVVAGMESRLGVVSPQVLNGVTYEFVAWRENANSTAEPLLTIYPVKNTQYTAVFKPAIPLRTPDKPANVAAGLSYAYYKGYWKALPRFDLMTPATKGVSSDFTLLESYNQTSFGAAFTGYIKVPVDGVYTFYSFSDDGSKLFIGDTLVVDNDGAHRPLEKSGSIGLKAGLHAIRVTYFNSYGPTTFQIKLEGPTMLQQVIPSTMLFREAPVECVVSGNMLREVWTWVPGRTVDAIPVQRNPSFTQLIDSFETTNDSRDQYGARIRGYICPPFNGQYTFWIAGDDNVELWLSKDANPATKERIAFVYGITSKIGYTALREWTKYESQRSVPITLAAGQRYYIEALHKEASGAGHVSVGWDLPNGVQERPIPGSRLSAFEIASKNARVSLDEELMPASSRLLAYPNPFSNKLFVQFSVVEARPVQLEMYDMQGRLVKKLFDAGAEKGSSHSFEVETSTLSTGLYIVRLTMPDQVLYKKVELIR